VVGLICNGHLIFDLWKPVTLALQSNVTEKIAVFCVGHRRAARNNSSAVLQGVGSRMISIESLIHIPQDLLVIGASLESESASVGMNVMKVWSQARSIPHCPAVIFGVQHKSLCRDVARSQTHLFVMTQGSPE
jgi:hypothetical protein